LPSFAYKALDAGGSRRTGSVEAASEADAIARLASDGIFISEISGGSASARSATGNVRSAKLAAFTRQLATMLGAGVPLARSLETISAEEADGTFRRLLEDVRERIHSGESFSEALSAHPTVFSPLYVNLVRVGEAGGVLDRMCRELAGFLERESELRSNVATAMIYPVLVMVLGVVMVFCVMTFVFPKLLAPFAQMNIEMPLPTRMVQGVSNFLLGWWWLVALAAAAAFWGVRAWAATPGGRMRLDEFKLKIPVLGPFLHKVAMMRFTMTLGTLTTCGVPVVDALEIVRGVLGNEHLAGVLGRAVDDIRQGGAVHEKLLASGFLAPVATQMIRVGEDSGKLDDILARMAESYDAQVRVAVRRLEAVLAPAVIIVVAVFIGFVILSVVLPILEVSTMGM